jgi:FMN phosphatase YigB (HAD superfamily)
VTTPERLKVNPNQSLHVGDDLIADVKGARDVGMKTAFVKRREIETNADIEIGRIAELTTLL